MSSPVSFRSYQLADAETNLEGLFIDALQTVYPHLQAGEWTSDLRNIPGAYTEGGGEFLVGVSDEAIVAIGGLRNKGNGIAEMKRVAVKPGVRGQHLGRQLVGKLEARASELGFTHIELDTTFKQEVARHIYDTSGYTLLKREDVAHPSGETFDTFYYAKELLSA